MIVSVPDHCLSFYLTFLPPGGKRSSLQRRIGATGPGVWQFGIPRCSSSRRIRRGAKVRSQICDRKLQI